MSLKTVASAVALLLIVSFHAGAQSTITAFKTGEETTGMTKQCVYDGLGSRYTKTVRSVDLCPLSIKVQTSPTPTVPAPAAPSPYTPEKPSRSPYTDPPAPKPSITAFKTGERTTGMTKQCYYNGLGNEYTKTVSSVDLCPLSIKVP